MKSVKYLIIGGGVAGTTAAETLRQLDAVASIAIVSDEPYRLYSRIMLSKPNFFLQKIPFEQIWLKTESWYKEKNIEWLRKKSGEETLKVSFGLTDFGLKFYSSSLKAENPKISHKELKDKMRKMLWSK